MDEPLSPAVPRRRALRYFLGACVLLILTLLGLRWACEFPGFRQWVLAQLQSQAAPSSVAWTASDFALDWPHRLEVRDLTLRASAPPSAGTASPPFLVIERLQIHGSWWTLWRERAVDQLVATGVTFDSGAPLPPADPADDPALGHGFTVHNLQLEDGQVRLPPSFPAADSWLTAVAVEDLTLTGSCQGGEAVLSLDHGTIRAERRGSSPLTLALRAKLRGALAGPVQLESLELSGAGLTLQASGMVGWRPNDPRALNFEFAAQAAQLIPELSADGELRGKGQVDLATWQGKVAVHAQDFPLSVLAPWLGALPLTQLRLDAARLDLDVALDSTDAGIAGQLTLAGRQGQESLLRANGRLWGGRLTRSAAQHPWAPGRLELGELAVQVRAKAVNWRAEWLEPWLAPAFGQQLYAGLDPAGTHLDWSADLTLEPGGAPHGEALLTWRRSALRLLQARAVSNQRGAAGPAIQVQVVADLLPDGPGKRLFTGELQAQSWTQLGKGALRAGRLELRLPDLAMVQQDLLARWPRLMPAALAEWPLGGSLAGTAELAGALTNPTARISATWTDGATHNALHLRGQGTLREPRGEVQLRCTDCDLASVNPWLRALAGLAAPDLAGRLTGEATLAGSPSDFSVQLTAAGTDLRYGDALPVIDAWQLGLARRGRTLELTQLAARVGAAQLRGQGRLDLGRPLERAALALELTDPLPGVAQARISGELAGGVLRCQIQDLTSFAGQGRLSAVLPLGALHALPSVRPHLARWPLLTAPGPVELEFDFPVVELVELLELFDPMAVDLPQNLRAALRGHLQVDLADLTAASGRLEIPFLNLATSEHWLDLETPAEFVVGNRSVVGRGFTVRADGQPFTVERAYVELAPTWQPGQPFAALIEQLQVTARGLLPATLFTPYLGGGTASGALQVELETRGPPSTLFTHLNLRGPEARIVYTSPYWTRFTDLAAELEISGNQVVVRSGRAQLNDGTTAFSGTWTAEAGFDLTAQFTGVRYRLDLGLSTISSGDLRLQLPPEGSGVLRGEITLERGVLDRNLNLDREILRQLFAPTSQGFAESAFDRIALDLELKTREGLRIKNNLADLRATWSPLRVRGPLSAPYLEGTIEIEPGGLVDAYGQIVRFDEATITFPGDPQREPELTAVLTTSLEDPSVGHLDASRFPMDRFLGDFAAKSAASSAESSGKRDALTAGIAAYYGDQLLGGLLGRQTKLSFGRPLLIFGEADPSRRLTITREISRHVALAVSVDLNAEGRQIYVLDLHDLGRLPRVVAQVFTNDDNNQGLALQQVREFGGGPRTDPTQPILRKIVLDNPTTLTRRTLLAALGWQRGQRLPDDVRFASEVDVSEVLRRRGYPAAQIRAELVPVPGKGARKVDLEVAIEPGPRVVVEFAEDQPSARQQREIAALYRLGFDQPAALAEMRAQTMRELQRAGFLAPTVEVMVENLAPAADAQDAASPFDQRVTISGHGGRQVQLAPPIFREIDDETAAYLLASFPSLLERVQLAVGDPAADRRVLQLLAEQGFLDAAIARRTLSADGKTLTVDLVPGPRRMLAAVEIVGVEAPLAEPLQAQLMVAPGEPARADRINAAAMALELALRAQGYARADVQPELTPLDDPQAMQQAMKLTFRAESGPQYRVADVALTGTRSTHPGWAAAVTQIAAGQPLDPRQLAEARRRLLSTGLFHSVLPTLDLDEPGQARPGQTRPGQARPGQAKFRFQVEELPRFSLAYGLRWESSRGGAAVFDWVDRNALGRGITLGLRGLYSHDDQRLRLYSAVPRVFGTIAHLELFLEGQDAFDPQDEVKTSRLEGTLQLAFPLSRRLTTRVYGRVRDTTLFFPDPFFPELQFELRTFSPVLGWQLLFDSRDDAVATTRGRFASVDLSGSGEFLRSDFSFARFFGQLKTFHSLGKLGRRPLVWAQSWRLGLANAFAGQELIRDERFFAGGEYSVRGYANESLGPFDDLGDSVFTRGGESLIVVNQELRWDLHERVLGLLFADFGNVWEKLEDVGTDFVTALGLGVRGRTPVGLLRFDLAFPLNRRPDSDAVKFYLGFGNTF